MDRQQPCCEVNTVSHSTLVVQFGDSTLLHIISMLISAQLTISVWLTPLAVILPRRHDWTLNCSRTNLVSGGTISPFFMLFALLPSFYLDSHSQQSWGGQHDKQALRFGIKQKHFWESAVHWGMANLVPHLILLSFKLQDSILKQT